MFCVYKIGGTPINRFGILGRQKYFYILIFSNDTTENEYARSLKRLLRKRIGLYLVVFVLMRMLVVFH